MKHSTWVIVNYVGLHLKHPVKLYSFELWSHA